MMLRTHTCGDARAEHEGQTLTLAGWVDTVRDHGGVVFIDLRDRYGRTQVYIHADHVGGEAFERAQRLRSEQVLQVKGAVRGRPDGMRNPNLATGDVELVAQELKVLSDCPPLPFDLGPGAAPAGDEVRFQYRYLDMRRDAVRERFEFRSRFLHVMREFLHLERFVELETPCLVKSTPEGARDFIVPSRTVPGNWFALPQSPQIFKQIFMVAGFDRYVQIVRCFRDEDLRADRQLEFTQLDLELAFVEEEDVLGVVERLMQHLIRELRGVELSLPLPRLTYTEALARYGSDKPDLRYGLELVDISDVAREVEFRVFRGAVEAGGLVKGLRVPGGARYSRKEIGELEAGLKDQGAKGLAWVKVEEAGLTGPVAKFLGGGVGDRVRERFEANAGDLLLFVADAAEVVHDSLAELRRLVAIREGLVTAGELSFVWVTDFPLLEHSPDEDRYKALHHPFTAPRPEDLHLLEEHPDQVRARAYDLVLNGYEIGGGSIRIHERDVQERVFRAIGMAEEETREKFSFLLEALRFGAPPHGGIALGIDRLVMVFLGLSSIREVIAFPKTQKGVDPLTGAPGPIAVEQLAELGLEYRRPPGPADPPPPDLSPAGS